MKMPWTGKSGLAKAVAFFATLLVVSIGLCGANFFAVIRFVPLAGPAPPPGTPTWPTTLLTVTGWMEIAGIAVGVCGLVIAGVANAWRGSRGGSDGKRDE
jgi:hypothetical protein